MIARLWDAYWAWTGGNIGAMPLQALISAACALLISPLLMRAWRRVKRAMEAAEAAHRIAADTHMHLTGRRHPDAPAPRVDS